MPIVPVTRRWWLTRLLPALFAFALALSMPLTGHAKVSACRGDPILVYGTWRIQSIIEIGAPISAVERVEYVYYLPKTEGIAVFYDDTPLAAKEFVTLVREDNLLAARVEVQVIMAKGAKPAAVTIISTLSNTAIGLGVTKTVSGRSKETLVTYAFY